MTTDPKHQIQAAFRGAIGKFSLHARFSVPSTGVTAILGPSGCGKTTVARCIAGLQYLPDGFCAVGDEIWQDATIFRKTHQRPIGYVFQEASLLAHLSVKSNLLYGAPRGKASPTCGAIDADEVIDLLGLSKLLQRSPHHLSGGERQRVAIGRALLAQPHLLMMDEPLSALDRQTKSEILPFLERLHQRLSLPVLYISHDMAEIERLADHLILMRNGQVLATGPLQALQTNPALPLAFARKAAVSLDAVVESYDGHYGLLTLRVAGGGLQVPGPPMCKGQHQRLRIAARDVSIAYRPPNPSSILNVLPARIVSKTFSDHGDVTVVVALGTDGYGARILAQITRKSWDQLGLTEAVSVYVQVKGVSLVPGSDASDILAADDTVTFQPTARSDVMPSATTADFNDINPNHLAAIVYSPEDDVDTLLANFADTLQQNGETIGGVVQRNLKDDAGRASGMLLTDLLTGRHISICQTLGSGATACKLDPAGLAEAAVAVSRAVADQAALIIVNKFSKQEAAGRGLRNELAEAIIAGGPVLTAVPEKCLDAWHDFTGRRGTTLLCVPHVVQDWWREVSLRKHGARTAMQATARVTSI